MNEISELCQNLEELNSLLVGLELDEVLDQIKSVGHEADMACRTIDRLCRSLQEMAAAIEEIGIETIRELKSNKEIRNG